MGDDLVQFDSRATPRLLAAMEANLVAHMAFLPSLMPGTRVVKAPDLTLVDSGVPSDTFNIVCGARLAPANANQRIEAAVAHFRAESTPFTWWTGPASLPADLGSRLVAHGFTDAEAEVAMALDLIALPDTPSMPEGLVVRRAASPRDLNDFARVMAANWDPPDVAVVEFYRRAAPIALARDFPARLYVGYLDGEPVATSECFLGHGVAGLYAVTTLPAVRRRGIGTAMTVAPLVDAQSQGYRTATLQASAGGERIYRRIGFLPVGTFREYKPDTGQHRS